MTNIPLTKWDERFLQLSELVGSWSKDPSTKVGAVITKGNRIISLGFNGFPPSIPDKDEWLNDRPTKYKYVIHAEMNAILNSPVNVSGCTLYISPLAPCPECAKHVVASGIKKVVAIIDTKSSSSFTRTLDESSMILKHGKVEYSWLQKQLTH